MVKYPVSTLLNSSCSTSPDTRIYSPLPQRSGFPSNIAEAIHLITKYQDGTLEKWWTEIPFSKNDYEKLKTLLKRYGNQKIRFDYDTSTLLLAIRMPAHVHDRLTEYLKLGIWEQVLKIRDSNNPNTELVKGIELNASAFMELQDGTVRHPDTQFRHEDSIYPGVIVEISNSQSEKDLAYLADQYVVRTSGCVQMVIGIKLGHPRSLKAELSVWRPHVVEESGQRYLVSKKEISSEVFRREDGTAVEGKSLVLRVKDFILPTLAQNTDDIQGEIMIPYPELAQYVNRAEKRLDATISSQSNPNFMGPGVICRTREQTPPEELESEEEQYYQREESKD